MRSLVPSMSYWSHQIDQMKNKLSAYTDVSLRKTDPDRLSRMRNFTLTGLMQLFLRHRPGVKHRLRSKAGVEFKATVCGFVRAAV